MDIYLDNNILVSIENNDYSLDKIKELIPSDNYAFFYSSAHIFEVESYNGNERMSKQDLLARRFESIDNIFQNNYLYFDLESNQLRKMIEQPQKVYGAITDVPLGITAMQSFSNLISKEHKKTIRDSLGIDVQKLNNYNPNEVVDHLNIKLSFLGLNKSFVELIEYAVKTHPNGRSFGLHNRIAAFFDLLDMFGYWKDKETETSNYARLWDSQHTFFASACDYFVCDDKRTRYKANVVYSIYDKDTKIISAKDDK